MAVERMIAEAVTNSKKDIDDHFMKISEALSNVDAHAKLIDAMGKHCPLKHHIYQHY